MLPTPHPIRSGKVMFIDLFEETAMGLFPLVRYTGTAATLHILLNSVSLITGDTGKEEEAWLRQCSLEGFPHSGLKNYIYHLGLPCPK